MKKIYFLIPFLVIFLCGCTKHYNTVEEYADAMNEVRNSAPSLTIEASIDRGFGKMTYKSFQKGDKWKLEEKMEGASVPMSIKIFNNGEILTYNQVSNIAIATPFYGSKQSSLLNPVYALYVWDEGHFGKKLANGDFIKNNAKMNNLSCRLIKYPKNDTEVCVSDKYGVAVYKKETIKTGRNKNSADTINVISISADEIPDSEFELPPGVKMSTVEEQLESLDKVLDELDKILSKMDDLKH